MTSAEELRGEELKRYRDILEQKVVEVRDRISAERAADFVHRPEEPLDFGDSCQKSHDQWLFLNQNRLEVSLFREVEAALRRIANGTYGICQTCFDPISRRRLEVLPWAKHCVACTERDTDSATADR